MKMTGSYDLGLFPGFIPQNTTFIRTTSSATAAIAIQNPISSPNRERVPNKRIQIFVQFIFSPPKAVGRNDAHRPFSYWSPAPCKAGYTESGMQNNWPAAPQTPAAFQFL